MHKKRWPIVILTILLSVIVLFSVGCSGTSDAEKEQAQQMADEFLEEKEESDDSSASADTSDTGDTGETTTDEDTVEEPPIYTFANINLALSSLDELTNFIGVQVFDKERIQIIPEPREDNIHFLTDAEPGMYRLESDIIYSGSFIIEIDPEYTGVPIEIMFQCDNYLPEIPVRVVCPDSDQSVDIREWFVPFFVVASEIPQEAETDYVAISAVFDFDADPSNNHQAHEIASKDFWQGGDTAYTMNYAPNSGWDYMMLRNLSNGFTPEESDSFGVIHNNLVAWFIPSKEIEVLVPGWLGSIHISDEMYSPESTGANTTNNNNPTLGLVSFDPDTRVSIYQNQDQELHSLPNPYELCSWIGCIPKFDRDGSESLISCECSGCTYDPECDCHIFALNTMTTPIGMNDWEYAIEGKYKYPMEMYHRYHCFCVKTDE